MTNYITDKTDGVISETVKKGYVSALSNDKFNENDLDENISNGNELSSEITQINTACITNQDEIENITSVLYTTRSNKMNILDEKISELIEYSLATSPIDWYKLRIRIVGVELSDSTENKFCCFLCKSIMYNPVQLEECGHRLCNKCWISYAETKDTAQCPIDNKVVNQDRVFIDTGFQKELENLNVYCSQNVNLSATKEGCTWQGFLRDFMAHFKSCPWRPVACPRECGHSIEFQNIKEHINKKCRLTWNQCPFCKLQVIASELTEHENTMCPEVLISCKNNCRIVKILPRKFMMTHYKIQCPLEPRDCPFNSLGCKIQGIEDEINNHLKRKAIPHLSLLAEGLTKNSHVLEESVKTILDEKMKCVILEHKINTLEKLWGSQLIWKVEKFFNKFNDSKSGGTTTYFSPHFYSSPYGYKLAMGLCPYGDGVAKGRFISLFVCICRGEYDNLLQWPFPLKVTFSLLDQAPKLENKKDIVYSFVPNIVKSNLPFLGRPQGERNPFFGARKFIAISSLMDRESYTLNQMIFFKVNIQEKSFY